MTQETFLLNTFFAYFFNLGDYLLILFSYAILIILIFSLVKYFFIKD